MLLAKMYILWMRPSTKPCSFVTITKKQLTMFVAFALLLLAAGARPEDRVIGGSAVDDLSTAPWQASLQRFGSHFCGASVIDSIHVMSACHCQYDNYVQVITGTIYWAQGGQERSATEFKCHPNYSSRTINYDYAIVTVDSAMDLSNGVNAIEVATLEYTGGTPAQITGWGLTDGSSNSLPNQLQVAMLAIVSPESCKLSWPGSITNQMVCAVIANEAGGCNGDSGGPLAVNDNGTWKLVGNVSWGLNGCATTRPTVFSKNSAVYGWIQTNSNI